ncbi:hypothetical protein LSAT2_012593 [Lamellibrachia satsuma]|nr:hypothetical protein LSAT2_012593 [Lamellibrachia satsuma]
MGDLKLYFDPMSQPSRAILLFLKANNIPFVEKRISLRKGEQLSQEFARINPFRKVPVIDDNGFILTESVAILKYLCVSRPVSDNWSPADICCRARLNEFNAWQHANLRTTGSLLFRTKPSGTYFQFIHTPGKMLVGLRTRDDRLAIGDATSAGREGDFIYVVSGEVNTTAGLGSTGSITDGRTMGGSFNDTVADGCTASSSIEGMFADKMVGGASLRLSDADGLSSLTIM